MEINCVVLIRGRKAGERIGLVRFYEAGYYQTDFDSSDWSLEEAQQFVDDYNERLGVPKAVAESAMDGSMFGWHVPAAQAAIEFFKAEGQKRTAVQS